MAILTLTINLCQEDGRIWSNILFKGVQEALINFDFVSRGMMHLVGKNLWWLLDECELSYSSLHKNLVGWNEFVDTHWALIKIISVKNLQVERQGCHFVLNVALFKSYKSHKLSLESRLALRLFDQWSDTLLDMLALHIAHFLVFIWGWWNFAAKGKLWVQAFVKLSFNDLRQEKSFFIRVYYECSEESFDRDILYTKHSG